MTKKQQIALSPQIFADRTLEELAFCDAKLKELNSNVDKEIFSVRQKYLDLISSYQETKDLAFSKLQAFATENPAFFPSNKKSVATKFGSFGFRMGKPHLVLQPDQTWEKVLDFLDDNLPSYIRIKYEVAKEKLLGDRDLPEVADALPEMGLSVLQSDTFFVDLTKTKA